MKIYNLGLDIQPGKYKYQCDCFNKLVKKFEPQKVTPFNVEIIEGSFEGADAIVYAPDKKLDLVVADLERIETRLARASAEAEKAALSKAQKLLEAETLLCDSELSESEKGYLKTLPLVSFKPCVAYGNAQGGIDTNELIRSVLAKAKVILFFTAGKKEVHAWNINAGSSILEAAGKIHSDLQRGFIKADVVNCSHIDNFFNMAEARSRGFVQVVDRDYIMQPNDIIEIRFNV